MFIHVPKTAGQWVAAALEHAGLIVGQLGVVHASPDEIRDDPAFRERGACFAMVRHPLTWYQSMWAHRMDESWEPVDDPDWFTPRWIETFAPLTSCRSDLFEDFVRRCLDRFPGGFVSRLYDEYTEGCTFVGRHERVLEDLEAALSLAGECFDAQRFRTVDPINVRSSRPRRQAACSYPPDLIERVLSVEMRCLERFDYRQLTPEIVATVSRG